MRLGALKEAWVSKGVAARIAPLAFSDIKSIAIIKHAALGDLVHTRPMIVALRKHFPNAAITFCAASHYTNGVPHDLVDRVHITCGKEKKYSRRELFQSFRALGRHDIIFDITQSAHSHWICLLNDALIKIGYTHKGIERFIYDIAIHRAELRFEAETFIEQIHTLGLNFDWPLDYGYTPLPSPLDGNYIVYFPTASVDYKIWPAERFVELIARSMSDYPEYRHVLLSGLAEWERNICDTIVDKLPAHCRIERVTGGSDTEALIANARLLVANDTGIRNMAIAHGTPTVGIFLPQMIYGYLPRFGLHDVAYTLDGTPPQVEDVYAKLTALLARIEQKPATTAVR